MTFSVADGSPLANRSRTFSNILSKSVILHYYFLSKSNRNKQMTASYARMGISHQFIDSSAAHKRLHRHLTSSCDSDKELLFVLSGESGVAENVDAAFIDIFARKSRLPLISSIFYIQNKSRSYKAFELTTCKLCHSPRGLSIFSNCAQHHQLHVLPNLREHPVFSALASQITTLVKLEPIKLNSLAGDV